MLDGAGFGLTPIASLGLHWICKGQGLVQGQGSYSCWSLEHELPGVGWGGGTGRTHPLSVSRWEEGFFLSMLSKS